MRTNKLKTLFLILLLVSILISLVACDSTKALNIQGDGTSVEKEMQQEVASTQRDYQKPQETDSSANSKENNLTN